MSMEYFGLEWLKRSRVYQAILILYAIVIAFFTLAQIPEMAKSIFYYYRPNIVPAIPSDSLGLNSSNIVELASYVQRLSKLEATITELRQGESSSRLDEIESEVKDLKGTLFGDPQKALTIQRLNIEVSSISDRMNSINSQIQWLFGISLTLALGVLATVLSVIKNSFSNVNQRR